ncbi:peptidoglycan DD-metalloendopeptidase family protein [Streptomyces sp. Z26]|uniref:M23 family metallopeptidase n=1 Tax=Streptomyces sp. Z26 TaxID=2500177 RepID=UPI003204DA2F
MVNDPHPSGDLPADPAADLSYSAYDTGSYAQAPYGTTYETGGYPSPGYDGYATGAFQDLAAVAYGEGAPLFGSFPDAQGAGAYDTGVYPTGAYASEGYDNAGAADYSAPGAYDETGAYATGPYAGGAYDSGAHPVSGYDNGGWNNGGYDMGGYDSSLWSDTGDQATGVIPQQYQPEQGDFGAPATADATGHWDASAYAAPQWDTSGGYEAYGTGTFDTTAFDTSALDAASFEQPSFDQAGAYDTGTYDTGAYDTGAFDGAAYDADGYPTDAYANSAYDTGSHDSSAWHTAAVDATAAYGVPEYAGAAYGQHPYEQEHFADQPHGEQPYDGQVHGEPAYGEQGVTAAGDEYDDRPAGPDDLADDGPRPHPDAEPVLTVASPSTGHPVGRGRRRSPRPRRSALLTVAAPSVAVLGVAGIAAASVTGVSGDSGDGDGGEKTTTQASPDLEVQQSAANNKLDTQLAGLSADADDFADRASRTQERIDLKKRKEEERERKAAEAARKEALRPKFAAPVEGTGISAQYGQAGVNWMSLHSGIDFPASYGTAVKAATDGTVSTQWGGSYGNMAIVTAEDGTETWYCHLSSTKIRSGSVKAGDVIAYSGNSGNSTGPHLHFEVRPGGGSAVDPLPWFRSHGIEPG